MLDNLIANISNATIQDFFRQQITTYQPIEEDLNYIIDDEERFEQFSELQKLGEVQFDDSDELLVFSCQYKGELSERSSKRKQFDIAKKALNEDFKDGAIFIFYDTNNKFRFSFIRKNYGDKEKKYSNWKRYTYFVNPEKPNKTFRKQINHCNFENLTAILKAFSIDAVTNEFYNEFKPHFDKVAESITGNAKFEAKQDFALLFVIRTIFIGFVQKRGWLGNNQEFIQDFWKEYKALDTKDDSFYKKWYEPLLFDAFNSPPGREIEYQNNNYSEQTRINLKMAPYLNGELFKRKHGIDTIGLFIPDAIIDDFFEFLFSYNFTIEENTRYDEELELNPEFLGIIFERLVNKEDGAVYTPRTEVDFMCRISLVKWLQKVSSADIKDLYHLFFIEMGSGDEFKDFQKDGDFSAAELRELIDLLKGVTVCDPSSGSGAFPVGMMQVLNEIIENLQNRDKTPDDLREPDAFKRKKAIMANSLYGVEVKRWAVWINQLRLWLSLFVDIPTEREAEFKNSLTPLLPNLGFKIRCGDSVVQRIGERLFPVHGHVHELSGTVKTQITELKKDKIDFFYNRSGSANSIRQKENQIFKTIINSQITEKKNAIKRMNRAQATQGSLFGDAEVQTTIKFDEKSIKKLQAEIDNLEAEREAFKNEHPLIWSIEFAEVIYDRKGFDVIIGNPPYVRQEDIADPNGNLKPKDYKTLLQETMRLEFPRHFSSKKEKISGKSDLFTYFYVKSLRLLNGNGIHTFICSNSWLDAEYGVWLKKFLLLRCNVHFIMDNESKRSFSTAAVNTIISLIDAPVKNKKDLNINTYYKFIEIRKPFEYVLFTENLLDLEFQNTQIISNSNYRSYRISIKDLYNEGCVFENEQEKILGAGNYIGDKWMSKKLSSPDIYFEIKKKGAEKIIELGNLMSYTQRNSIEVFDKIYETNLTSEKTIPFLNSSKQIHKIHANPSDIDNYIDLSKSKYKTKGVSYKKPDLISNRFIGERLFFIEGDDFVVGDTFFIGEFIEKEKKEYYLACLNSTLTLFNVLLIGRKNMGDGVLLFYGPELKQLEVFLPTNHKIIVEEYRKMKSRKINNIFTELGFNGKQNIRDQVPNPIQDRKVIDKVIFEELGLTADEINEIYWSVGELMKKRTNKAKSV